MLSPGTRLGPYEILALLGAGGMGEVYRARDTRLDRSVAIKVLPQHLSSSPPSRILAEFASGPHWRPDGERIGYQLTGIVSQSSTLELWSVRPDGTDQRLEYRDTLCTGADRISFAWSPDGRKIAWLRSFDNERRQELVIRDLASGKERQLTHDGKNIDEVWWTRQKEIAFSSNRGGSTNLWLIRASGGEPTRITKGVGPDIGVRVSADGKTLLYLQRRPIGHIWIGNLDKGGARQVTHEDLVLGAPVLSPDLQRIAVPILDPDPLRRAGGVFVMNLQGKERRQITPENVSPLSAHWSPDGRWIAYSATGGSASTDSALVCVVEAATPGTPRPVARGTLVKWIDDSTLYVVRRLQSGLVSVHTGLERETSPDSTYRVPLRGGYSLVTDFRRGREGWWLQPAGPQESQGAGPRFVAPLSLPILGGAPDRSFLLCIDEDGKPFKIVLPSGRRVPIQAALPGLSSQSLVGIAWTIGQLLTSIPGSRPSWW